MPKTSSGKEPQSKVPTIKRHDPLTGLDTKIKGKKVLVKRVKSNTKKQENESTDAEAPILKIKQDSKPKIIYTITDNPEQNKVVQDLLNKIIDNFDDDKYIFEGEKGHATLFVDYNKDDIHLCSLNGDGYYFNKVKNIWHKLENGSFVKIVLDFLEDHIQAYITKIRYDKTKSEELKDAGKALGKARMHRHAENVWKIARCSLVDNDFQIKMNNAPNLLPLKDGKIIDLKTLDVRLRQKTDYFDFELPFEFNKNLDLTYANKFFNDVMNNVQEIVTYLQIILGYCITGETKMRLLFIFWGTGSNGKSTLCELLKEIMGKYHTAADKKIFIKQESTSAHTSHLIPLVNARLAVLSETEKDEKLNEGLIKSLTGNDVLSMREVHGKQFSFKPFAKFIMLTNNKPIFDVNSIAMIKRIRYIPFRAVFEYNPIEGQLLRDDTFIEKLKTEYLNEVFVWLCIGANNYYKSNGNVKVPKSLEDAKNDYINEIDNVSKFIEDMCNREKDSNTKQSILYDGYMNYCKDNGYIYVRNSEFYKRLESLGFKKVIIKGYSKFKDIKLEKTEDDYLC